jgi:hypothetical protein
MRVFERVPGLKDFRLRQKSDRHFHVQVQFDGPASGSKLRRAVNAFRLGLPEEVLFTAEPAVFAGLEKGVRFATEVEA